MRPRLFLYLSVMILAIMVVSSPVPAQWSPDGIMVCGAPETQYSPKVAPDGTGGSVIVWEDYRHYIDDVYVPQVYAQRFDSLGNELWAPGGVRVAASEYSQIAFNVLVDLYGKTWIAFETDIPPNSLDIVVQKLDSDGNPDWGSGALALTNIPGTQANPMICSDNVGGVLVAWNDGIGTAKDIFCQRIEFDGNILFAPGGYEFVWAAEAQVLEGMVSDGANGFIAVYQDYRFVGDQQIYAHHILGNGTYTWNSNGHYICNRSGRQGDSKTISDGNGGAIVVWEDERDGNNDIYTQGISFGGALHWPWEPWGVLVAMSNDEEEILEIATDGNGGAIFTWTRFVVSPLSLNVYANRIDADGSVLWGAYGIKLNIDTDCYGSHITHDNDNGAFISWVEDRGSGKEYYCQRIDSNGIPMWEVGGVRFTESYGSASSVSLVSDGNGGCISAWYFNGPFNGFNIFAQRLGDHGSWGYPHPVIHSVADVPADQGGYARVSWDASQHDAAGEVNSYSIWRSLDTPDAILRLENGAVLVSSPKELEQLTAEIEKLEAPDRTPALETPAFIRQEDMAGAEMYWEFVGSHGAYSILHYADIVPTPFDSCASYDGVHYFQVMTHGNTGDSWISETMSGYSVDNLAPATPCGLTGEPEYNPPAVTLSWEPNIEADFACYRVYRGDDIDFVPSEAYLVATTNETDLFDDYSMWSGAVYKVTAVDIHGNESIAAVLGSGSVTGDDPMPLPDATFLAQNYPNPFNPITTIAFSLKESGFVSLQVYDAAGRLVTTLVSESRPAGSYSTEWNGRGTDGTSAASGVYFYRLLTGEFEETKKMILLR